MISVKHVLDNVSSSFT